MGGVLAAGIPGWPTTERGFDPSPVFLVLVAVLVARFLFGMELTRTVIVASILGGVFTSWLADVAGLVPASGFGLAALAVGSAWRRRSQLR
ncbi:MAG: hypothetical protein L0206_12485 [Actinobacteria bacterium]|nr:hypothetical protein [Actinomycetota bacterium]